ncbi:hypothetical protein AOLI_G00258860 [Acnodon oligacanthus]
MSATADSVFSSSTRVTVSNPHPPIDQQVNETDAKAGATTPPAGPDTQTHKHMCSFLGENRIYTQEHKERTVKLGERMAKEPNRRKFSGSWLTSIFGWQAEQSELLHLT